MDKQIQKFALLTILSILKFKGMHQLEIAEFGQKHNLNQQAQIMTIVKNVKKDIMVQVVQDVMQIVKHAKDQLLLVHHVTKVGIFNH